MKARVNGININYRVDGRDDAPWVTFSNSLVTTHRMWDDQVDAFSERFRLLRYDQRGHGDTDAPPGPYTLDMLTDDVLGLLDALGIDQTHFIGCSMGGMTGINLALREPSKLRALVLCDTPSRDPYNPAIWEQRFETIRTAGTMEPMVGVARERFLTALTQESRRQVSERILTMVRRTPIEGYIGCSATLSGFDPLASLSAIDVPTLVVVGEQDASTPVAMAEELHERIAGSRLVILEGAAHLSNVDQPEAFNEAVLEFLAAH